MICCLMHIIGILAGAIGMILTWIVTFMPYWRLVVLAENNNLINEGGRIDGEWISRWDGLWLTCLKQYRTIMECESYGSMVSLTTDLKAARMFMCLAITIAVIAFVFSIIGCIVNHCSRCYNDNEGELHCFTLTAGILYLFSTALVLAPVIWTTVSITRRSYDAQFTMGAVRIEIGQSLYLAWPNIAFLLVGGIILTFLCCLCSLSSCCKKDPCIEKPVFKKCQAEDERVSCSPRMVYL